jgi:hypothetical protein
VGDANVGNANVGNANVGNANVGYVGWKSAAHSAIFARPGETADAAQVAEYAALFRPTSGKPTCPIALPPTARHGVAASLASHRKFPSPDPESLSFQ